MTLNGAIDTEKSSFSETGYCISIKLVKKEGKFWKFLTDNDKLYKNVKVDWNFFVDPEAEEEEKK